MIKLFTIAKNTFTETVRHPIYAVIIIAVLLLITISPSITMYSLEDDDKLLREIGLSTLFLASLFIAILSASGSVAEEIENKTILTVISKPIQRPIFIFAKFIGVAAAVILAHYICTIAFLMAVRHGVLETVNDPHDWTVITAAGISAFCVFVLSAFFNYVYDWKFSSTAIVLLAIFATLSIIFLAFIDNNWQFNPSGNGINALDVFASLLLVLAAAIIAALAVAFSTRFNISITLSFCVGIFLLGLVTDSVFAELAQEHLWAKICYFLIPNLQIFWISDAIHEQSEITFNYIAVSALYSSCYAAAILLLAIASFQRRQVG